MSALAAVVVAATLGCGSPSQLYGIGPGTSAHDLYGASLIRPGCYLLMPGRRVEPVARDGRGRVLARLDTDWWLWLPAGSIR